MDVTNIVKEMISAGMPDEDILSNLADLGIPEPQKVLLAAKAASKPAAAAAKQAPKPVIDEIPQKRKTSLFDDETTAPKAAKPSFFDEKPSASDSQIDDVLKPLSGGEDSDQKLDELIAITTSLLDLNKKILESNREILLRLQK